ncbi:MAG: hypothetical protein OEZ58_09190 [Gammaproteobacteria bacterium]|nr:hypothetical protein [Gammaproteobacteria bacterium]MDH5729151.1 hypothetical protein [Gammaproteobacteria bacterium]
MTIDFQRKVRRALEDFFSAKGFKLDETLDLDGGNKSLVFYSSPLCKLCFYQSERDGEVNCLIGTIEASNEELDNAEWSYLNSLISDGEQLSIEELLAGVPDTPMSDEEQLSEIAIKLKQNFDALVKQLPN